MPIILKDKKCIDCGCELLQVHPAVKRCGGCKEVQKQEKLRILAETYKKPKVEIKEPDPGFSTLEGEHRVQIYAMPLNPFLRLIEFEDGTHGRVAVRRDSSLRTGMWITVRKEEGAAPHSLVGRYNRWGVRVA